MVVPESRPFPPDTGVSQLSSDGTRPEPRYKDREHGGHPRMLVHNIRIEHSTSINRCLQVWLDSSRSFRQKLEYTHK